VRLLRPHSALTTLHRAAHLAPVQARSARAPNFIRTLASVAEVQALRIVQPTTIPALMRLDRLARFILERVSKELSAARKGGGSPSPPSLLVAPPPPSALRP
jgi:hypothetical protein